jgi:hypothetical protein
MSHISEYSQKIKDKDMFLEICEQLGYETRRGDLIVKQFGRNEVRAIGSVKLPGWNYEVALTEDGKLKYDHWGSEKDSMDYLGLTIQRYNDAKVRTEIPYDEIEDWTTEEMPNGDKKIVLEYA